MPSLTEALLIASAAALVTTAGAMLNARWKNRTDKQLKEKDLQNALDLAYQNRKAQAADTIIKSWSLVIARLNHQEKFYQHMVTHGYGPEFLPVAQRYEKGLKKIVDKLNADDSDSEGLFNRYFASHPSVTDEFKDELAEYYRNVKDQMELEDEIKRLVLRVLSLREKSGTITNRYTYAALHGAYVMTEVALMRKVREVLGVIQLDKRVLELGCAAIRSEADFPKAK